MTRFIQVSDVLLRVDSIQEVWKRADLQILMRLHHRPGIDSAFQFATKIARDACYAEIYDELMLKED